MVMAFQLDYGVIPSKDDPGAGVYGPKTRAALAAAHTSFQIIQEKEMTAIEEARKQLLDEHTAWGIRYDVASRLVATIGYPKL